MALQTINRYRECQHHTKIGIDLLAPHNWHLDPDTGCWIWNWTITSNGYAQVSHSGRIGYVIRILAGVVGCGPSVEIRHESFCDRACVNPAHLTIGDPSSNQIDRSLDGPNGRQVLTAEQVYQIKFRDMDYRNGRFFYRYLGQRNDLAKFYDVALGTISNIKSGRVWAWLHPEMDLTELRQQRPGSYAVPSAS